MVCASRRRSRTSSITRTSRRHRPTSATRRPLVCSSPSSHPAPAGIEQGSSQRGSIFDVNRHVPTIEPVVSRSLAPAESNVTTAAARIRRGGPRPQICRDARLDHHVPSSKRLVLHQHFQHGERLRRRGVYQGYALTMPPTCIQARAIARKGGPRKSGGGQPPPHGLIKSGSACSL